MPDMVTFQLSRRIATALGFAARTGFDSLDPQRAYTIGEAVRSGKPCQDIITRDEWTEVEEVITGLENQL